jgi:hypothetical protein
VPHGLAVLFSLTGSSWWYQTGSTNHEAPQCHFRPIKVEIFSTQHSVLEHSHPNSSHNKRQMFTHSYKTTHKNLVYFNLYVLENRWEDNILWIKQWQAISNLICSYFLDKYNFGLLGSFSNIQTLPHFQRIY